MYKYREKTMFSNEAALDVMAEDFDQFIMNSILSLVRKHRR